MRTQYAATDMGKFQDFLVVPPDAPSREAFYLSGDLYTFLATSEETGGQFSLFDFFVPPEGGPPLHIHYFEDEFLYILEGEPKVQIGNEIMVGLPGTFLYLPKGRPHRFFNDFETTPARTLSLLTPAGILENLFREAGYPVTDRSAPPPPSTPESIERLVEAGARHKSGILVRPGEPLPATEGLKDFFVVPPDASGRESVSIAGGLYTYLATYEETSNQFALFNAFLPPQAGSGPLPIPSQDQALYILNGELSLELGDQTTVLTPGTFVYLPNGKSFAYQNLGTTPVRTLVFATYPAPTSKLSS